MNAGTWVLPIATLAAGYFSRELFAGIRSVADRWIYQRAVANDLIFPLVRVSDELVGRTYHYIRSDFQNDKSRPKKVDQISDHNQMYDLYLWSRFWAQTSRIRRNVLSYNLSKTSNGRDLLKFLDCLEANKVSILPRAYQKFVGDGFSDRVGVESGGSYFKFVHEISDDPFFSSSLDGLNELYREAFRHKKIRHEFIKYMIIIHAMNDYLDPKRKVSSPREAMQNKLGKADCRDLRLRILAQYTPLSESARARYA